MAKDGKKSGKAASKASRKAKRERSLAKLPAKKDRHVAQSSKGKFVTVAALEAHRKKVTKTKPIGKKKSQPAYSQNPVAVPRCGWNHQYQARYYVFPKRAKES